MRNTLAVREFIREEHNNKHNTLLRIKKDKVLLTKITFILQQKLYYKNKRDKIETKK